MKFRFATTYNCHGFREKTPRITYLAFDTQEIAAWRLHTFEDDLTGLELWCKGISDSLLFTESDVGSPMFQAVLNLLASEFPDINELKVKATIEFEG